MDKRITIISGLMISLFLISANYGYCVSLDEMFGGKTKECQEKLEAKEKENQQLIQEKKELESLNAELKGQNTALSSDFQKQGVDNKNLLEQIKVLSKDKEDLLAAKEAFEKVNEQNSTLLDNKEAAQQEAKSLKDSIEKLKSHLAQLTQDKIRLEGLLQQQATQAAQAAQAETVDKNTGKLKTKTEALEEELKQLKKEKIDLTNQLRQSHSDVVILENNKVKLQAEVEGIMAKLDELEEQNADLRKENQSLEGEARTFPTKFADLAQQNKRLIEQSADMHYNSGVFFVKNKEYKQAIKEFERVLEVKPDHAYANYNLGYIYAEYMVDRKKAIDYFKNYLTYAPDAKDADWVRKYIYTWQTWYGKEKMK